MKKVFCILLSLLLVICVIPFASAAQRPDYSMFVNGYEDADYTAPALSGGKASNRGTSALPESFSMKDLLPEARVQGDYGSCWAFSTIGAAEANIIKKGLADKKDLDLSELQFIHYAYGKPVDPLGNFTGDYAFRTDGDLMNGGNFVYACNAVARWTAFTDEAAMPYADAEFAREHSYADEFAIDMSEFHAEGFRTANINTDRNAVKECLLDFGAVCCSYLSDDDYYSYDGNSYYSDCYSGNTNHSVLIVGWDDNYSKDNFDGAAKPQNDGAWLIRNSWGSWNHDDGYFWLSYEESSLDDTVFAYDMATSDNFDYNYQYDGGEYSAAIKTDGLANVFTANSDELLKAVSFVFELDTYVSYNVSVYLNPKGTDFINTAEPAATAEGCTKYAGMYTVRLDEPLELTAGDRFAVVVTATDSEGGFVRHAYDKTYSSNDWFGSVAVYEPCEGYYINNGSLHSMSTRGTPRIKAYTDTAGLADPENVEAVNIGGEITVTWNAVEGADSYEVYFGADDSGYEIAGETADTEFVCEKSSADGVLGKFKVKAVKGEEKSIFSKTEVVKLCDPEPVVIALDDFSVAEFENKPVEIIFTPEDAADKTVNITVADSSVAKIEDDGSVTGIKAGTTEITVTARSGGMTVTAVLTVTAHAHVTEVTGAKTPTCTEKGFTGVTTCTLCGKELDSGSEIPETGHTPKVTKTAKAASCTENGNTEEIKCEKCGTVLTASEVLVKTGHKFTDETVAPTCTAKGYTTHTCTVCEYSYADSETAAKGHADADSDGYCDECGKSLGSSDSGKTGGSFFDKILDFFRKIIEFFKNLFS